MVETPTATPAAGAIDSGTPVVISTATPGAKILYTTDDSIPSMSSAVYESPIVLTGSGIIKAIAVKEGMDPSGVLTAIYTIN